MFHEIPIQVKIVDKLGTLLDSLTGTKIGVVDGKAKKILEVLQKKIFVQLFLGCISPLSREYSKCNTKSKGRRKREIANSIPELCAILYGPGECFEPVGLFTAQCNLYLQHPKHCDRNVPYRNPHCLSPENSRTIYTFDLDDRTDHDDAFRLAEFSNPIDLFADTMIQEALVEADPPRVLSTKLYKHQKQALTFMTQRECGWALSGHRKDVWRRENDALGRVLYQNTISGQQQLKPPAEFRGGLLIDAPGLGKSLSILALIAADAESRGQSIPRTASFVTLIVVPKTCKRLLWICGKLFELSSAVIQMWKDELQK